MTYAFCSDCTLFVFVGYGINKTKVRFQVLTAVSMKMAVFWDLCCVVWYKFNNVSEVLAASIIRVMSFSHRSVHVKFVVAWEQVYFSFCIQ
jgi:hypothetical protein